MLRDDDTTDAFWRLQTTRTDVGWNVAYLEEGGGIERIGEIVTDGHKCTVWFLEGGMFPVTCHDFDTAIDCVRDYLDASQLGLSG